MEPVSAGIMAGATLINGIMQFYGMGKQNEATQDYNQQQMAVWNKQFDIGTDFKRQEVAITKRAAREGKRRYEEQHKDYLEERNWNRKNEFANQMLSLMNGNRVLKQDLMNIWPRRN